LEEAAQKAQLERWLAELSDEKEDAIAELQAQMSGMRAGLQKDKIELITQCRR